LSQKLGRKINHVNITEDELTTGMSTFLPAEYARLLAQLDTAIKNGAEERLNTVLLDVTGRKPRKFLDFVDSCVENGVWVKKET
jgi:festuclavine dehydrogenase